MLRFGADGRLCGVQEKYGFGIGRRMIMELWDIYDAQKRRTGRTMKKNDWCLKEGEYHLTVLGIVAHSDGRFLINDIREHFASLFFRNALPNLHGIRVIVQGKNRHRDFIAPELTEVDIAV